ncbi:hypothetical protein [Terrabacter sp. NPDC000476]|uniref:hypothetical protein n=1 Tax=Terrabacter sp. NPDC000476 TaxID=3154258 RepID=UPI00332AC40C
MATYEVYATSWSDPHIVETLLPARELSFSMPLSDHGECTFSATVEPGKSFWRQSVSPPLSGILIARDGVPCWSGWITADRQVPGTRTFQFTAREWGLFFATTPARVRRYDGWTDQSIIRDLIDYAQAQPGQNVHVDTGPWVGGNTSLVEINAWDDLDSEAVLRRIAEAEGGPEWYFGTAGELMDPKRVLVLGTKLGQTTPVDTLMYVEDTEDWAPPSVPGVAGITLLSNLFPVATIVAPTGRRGGNVLAMGRTRDTARSTTVARAVGAGVEAASLQRSAQASKLLAAGWPRMTRWFEHNSVTDEGMLQRHANADLAASAGIATGYSLVSLDGDPDWTQVPRGSVMRIVLDTDVYAGPRPYTFDSRLLGVKVDVPDDGGTAQVQWDVAERLEVD